MPHPRNRHQDRYDFPALLRACPSLQAFVRTNPTGDATIDFADPVAVRALNQALLRLYYGVVQWDIPPDYLCPPIPGRADYVHHLADLLATAGGAPQPRGDDTVVLDIGVGANCVYPIIGVAEYGWRFVGSDIDPVALAAAKRTVVANRFLASHVELRLQTDANALFSGVVKPGETFAASMCNPPFHDSPASAAAGTRRKLRNLAAGQKVVAALNFGGRHNELWCPGGEVAFIRRLIAESACRPALCRWFTTLVSKRESLPLLQRTLSAVRPAEVRTIDLAQGQKKSRILAWRFSPA